MITLTAGLPVVRLFNIFIIIVCSEQNYGLEVQYLVGRCKAIMALAEPILNSPDLKPITHQHVNALIQQVHAIAETAFCMPRFYFQTLQSTTLKVPYCLF